MKKLFTAVLIVAGALVLFSNQPASADLSSAEKGRLGLEVISWWPTVTGEVAFDLEYIGGTELDLIDELDIDETVTTIELGAWLNITKRNRFSFYWFMDQRTGSRVLEESVTVAGKKYSAGGEMDTDLQVQRYKFLYERALFRNDIFRLSLGTGVSYLDAIVELEGEVMGGLLTDSEQERLMVAVPVIAGAAEVHLPLGFGAFVEGCGMGIKYHYASAQYYDVRGGVNWKSRFVFAQAGYQHLEISGEAFDNLDITYSLSGPFVALGAKF